MRTRLDDHNCSVARTLDILSDPWTLLIVRDAFIGVRRFRDFEAGLGVSKNVLSARLERLVEEGLLETVDAGRYGRRLEYQLTAKGKDLVVVMTALREWGDRWIFGEGHEPVQVLDRRTGRPVPRLRIMGEDGKPVPGAAMQMVAGPGASAATRARHESQTS